MVDDSSAHREENMGDFDPNAITHDGDTSSPDWLDSTVAPKHDEWLGKTIGQFEIIQIIGAGGMGNVYEAKQSHPHRSVALKIVKSAAATPATLHRFEMESEMLARLQHPGIAQVYDSGHQMFEETLLPYFAMEYVPGSRHITDYAEEEHLGRDGRLELLLLVCNAVQYGHGRGVIHRDLKPSNILITSAGRPKVIDFGVALMADSDDVERTVTITGRFVGTLQWSSPEQCGDDPHDVDVRTDVYSLGVIMYQLMVGHLPYEMKGIPLYRAPLVVRETKPIPPRSVDPAIPIEIEQILAKALAKERNLRYESVTEFAMDIRRYLNNEPIHARPPSAIHRLKLYAKRNQLKFKAGIVVFLAIILGLTGLIWGLVESEKRAQDLEQLYAQAHSEKQRAQQKAYTATIGTAQAAIANKSWKMARNNLASTEREYRGWEWSYLQGMVDQSIGVWAVGSRPNLLVTSMHGKHLAIAFEGVRVGLIDEDREVLRTIQMPERINTLSFSRDGELLFVGMSNGQIAIVDILKDTLLILNEVFAPVESIDSMGDKVFSTGHSDGLIYQWNTDGTLLNSVNSGRGTILTLKYSQDGKFLAVGKAAGTIQVFDVNSGKIVMLLDGHDEAVHDVVFLEDGILLTVGGDGTMKAWDVASQKELASVTVSQDAVFGVAVVDDLIATAGEDSVVRLWEKDFTLAGTLRGHNDLVWSVGSLGNGQLASVSRDGTIKWWSTEQPVLSTLRTTDKLPASDISFVWNDILAVVSEFDSDLQLMDVFSGKSKMIFSPKEQELTIVKNVPSTSLVVTGNVEGGVELWDVDGGEFEETIGLCEGQISALAVSEFGKHIAAGTLSGNVYVWSTNTRQLLMEAKLGESNIVAMELGEEEEALFVVLGGELVIGIDVATQRELWRCRGYADIVAMAFNKVTNVIIVATASNSIHIIDPKDGIELQVGNASGDALRDLALFPDGKRFATVLADGTLSIWDANDLYLIASFPASRSADCISISSDGHIISVAGGASTIKLMDGMSRSARQKNTKE